MAQRFMTLVSWLRTMVEAIIASTGASDAGKIIAANAEGKLDTTFLPAGIGANVQIVNASEAIGAGKFVNLWNDGGTLKARLADNSNGRYAHGFVKDAVTLGNPATVYPLDVNNTALAGLIVGSRYYLGTAGGVVNAPLDPTNVANANKVHQYLGVALSATELITDDDSYVTL